MKREWKDQLLILTIISFQVFWSSKRQYGSSKREVLRTDFEGPGSELHHRLMPAAEACGRRPSSVSSIRSAPSACVIVRVSAPSPRAQVGYCCWRTRSPRGSGWRQPTSLPARLQELVDRCRCAEAMGGHHAGEAELFAHLEYLLLKRVGLHLQPDLVSSTSTCRHVRRYQLHQLAVFDASGDRSRCGRSRSVARPLVCRDGLHHQRRRGEGKHSCVETSCAGTSPPSSFGISCQAQLFG